MMLAGMAKDFSWKVSAAEYARLVRALGWAGLNPERGKWI